MVTRRQPQCASENISNRSRSSTPQVRIALATGTSRRFRTDGSLASTQASLAEASGGSAVTAVRVIEFEQTGRRRSTQMTFFMRSVPVAVLDGEPDVWLVEGATLLFITESGLWSVETKGGTKRIHRVDLASFSPTSLV